MLLIKKIMGQDTHHQQNSTLRGWGNNTAGQVGRLPFDTFSIPVAIGEGSWVAVGGKHAITNTGILYGWGDNTRGDIGNNSWTGTSVPVAIPGNSWAIISHKHFTVAAIDTAGHLFTWGLNDSGQLGDGTTISKSSPVQIGTSSWVAVRVGYGVVGAIRSDGKLFTWGQSIGRGGLGDGNPWTQRSSPVQVGTDTWRLTSPQAALSMSWWGGKAIRSDGKLFAWGSNNYGQLGDGTTIDKFSPAQIGTSSWAVVGNGSKYHSIAIRSDGKLFTWGKNANGQLGDGTTISKSSPVQIGTSNWFGVGGGIGEGKAQGQGLPDTDFTAAIRTDRLLFIWGANNNGTMGNGTIDYYGSTDKSSPVQIGSNSWAAISSDWGFIHGIVT
jgi:alpha-tubulin suppressor-like RCC1 family protein